MIRVSTATYTAGQRAVERALSSLSSPRRVIAKRCAWLFLDDHGGCSFRWNTPAGSAFARGTGSFIRTLILTGRAPGPGALRHSGALAGGNCTRIR